MNATLNDGRIAIRPYREADIQFLYEAVRESVNDLSPWMSWCSPAYSMKETAEFVRSRPAEWERGEHYSFVVEDVATSRFLGGAGLNFINRIHNLANLGYWVRTSATGQGIASAAVQLAARFGFHELGFNRLEIIAGLGNVASQRVADRAGARREGVLRKRLQIHDQVLDAVLFSLVPEDLRPW